MSSDWSILIFNHEGYEIEVCWETDEGPTFTPEDEPVNWEGSVIITDANGQEHERTITCRFKPGFPGDYPDINRTVDALTTPDGAFVLNG